MTTQPQALALALALADALDEKPDSDGHCRQAAAMLRTQHVDLERKDALLKQAVNMFSQCIRYDFDDEPLDEFDVHAKDLCDAITKELAK